MGFLSNVKYNFMIFLNIDLNWFSYRSEKHHFSNYRLYYFHIYLIYLILSMISPSIRMNSSLSRDLKVSMIFIIIFMSSSILFLSFFDKVNY